MTNFKKFIAYLLSGVYILFFFLFVLFFPVSQSFGQEPYLQGQCTSVELETNLSPEMTLKLIEKLKETNLFSNIYLQKNPSSCGNISFFIDQNINSVSAKENAAGNAWVNAMTFQLTAPLFWITQTDESNINSTVTMKIEEKIYSAQARRTYKSRPGHYNGDKVSTLEDRTTELAMDKVIKHFMNDKLGLGDPPQTLNFSISQRSNLDENKVEQVIIDIYTKNGYTIDRRPKDGRGRSGLWVNKGRMALFIMFWNQEGNVHFNFLKQEPVPWYSSTGGVRYVRPNKEDFHIVDQLKEDLKK